jgi:hypothetical protein
MADEREISVVIKAPQELLSVLGRVLTAAAGRSGSLGAIGSICTPEDIATLNDYEEGIKRVSDLEASLADSRRRASAEKELLKLTKDSPYKPTADGLAGTQADYDARLAELTAYNASVIQAMIAAGSEQSRIDAAYTDLSIQYARARRDAQIAYASESFGAASDFMQNLYVATGSQNEEMFTVMKAFAVAQTVMDTYRAAQGAYAALAGIPVVGPALGVAAAAAAIAAGAARVAQIQATEPGTTTAISTSGEGYTSYSGGAYESTATETDTKSTQTVTVNIYNPLSTQNWAQIVEDDIIPALNDAADRDISITINEM